MCITQLEVHKKFSQFVVTIIFKFYDVCWRDKHGMYFFTAPQNADLVFSKYLSKALTINFTFLKEVFPLFKNHFDPYNYINNFCLSWIALQNAGLRTTKCWLKSPVRLSFYGVLVVFGVNLLVTCIRRVLSTKHSNKFKYLSWYLCTLITLDI